MFWIISLNLVAEFDTARWLVTPAWDQDITVAIPMINAWGGFALSTRSCVRRPARCGTLLFTPVRGRGNSVLWK